MKMLTAAIILSVLTFGSALAFAAQTEKEPNSGRVATTAEADMVYFNGTIVTLDASGSTISGVAVKDGKILRVGGSDEMKKLVGTATQLIDLGGKTVVPGLIDAHCHPMETIYLKEDWVDSRYPKTKSVKQALDNLAAWVKKTPKGKWIYVACVSASENKFAEKRLPTKTELDAVAPDNPVVLANGAHMVVVNSQTLQRLGVKKGMTKLPHGGAVILDKNDEPTGVLADTQSNVPAIPTPGEMERYYTKSIQEFWNQYGFTSLLAITPAAALPVFKIFRPVRNRSDNSLYYCGVDSSQWKEYAR